MILVATKLIHRPTDKAEIELPDDERTRQNAIGTGRSKATIVAETGAEKAARKLLAKRRRRERSAEQQHVVKHMENLMDKVVELDATRCLVLQRCTGSTRENSVKN